MDIKSKIVKVKKERCALLVFLIVNHLLALLRWNVNHFCSQHIGGCHVAVKKRVDFL